MIPKNILSNHNYKNSKFNILFEQNGKVFIFNTLRGSFLEITPTNRSIYQWLGDATSYIIKDNVNNFHERWVKLGPKARENLLLGGFIIPPSFDEFEYLKFKNKAERYRRDYYSLTVALTYACNMGCIYCYENAPLKSGSMSLKTAQQLIAYIEGIIKDGCKNIDITWYGGEPMIKYPLIVSLSRKIINLARKNKVQYKASIITNGTLLTRRKAKILKKYHVDSAQITLDGPAIVHDQRRPLKTGPSFESILKNILDVHDVIHINIRCNVDKTNSEKIAQLVDILKQKGLSDKVAISFAPVNNGPKKVDSRMACAGNICSRKLYSYKTFSKIQTRLQDYASSSGFYKPSLPNQKFNACTADRINGVVVEPNGNLVKCWESLGDKEENIGNLEKGITLSTTALRWLNYDPFSYKKCKVCKMLPICMGWCPARVMTLKSEWSCQTLRYNLVNQLIKYCEYAKKGGEINGNNN